jgi:hypothetical protein
LFTLAVTLIVPPTVEPESGDVTETIKPPSCAETGGDNDNEARTIKRTVARIPRAVVFDFMLPNLSLVELIVSMWRGAGITV